jgi:hypothetical protein
MAIDGEIAARAMQEFEPNSMAVLQQLLEDGEEVTGIKTSQINTALTTCQMSSNRFLLERCATQLSAIGQTMR